MSRVPTENQYRLLRVLAGGCMLVSGIGGERRAWRSLLEHGWVAPDDPDRDRENGLRITPAGLRALADAVDRYGLPDLGPRKDEPPPEPPLVQRLRTSRDEARSERDDARRELRHAETMVRAARRALGGRADL